MVARYVDTVLFCVAAEWEAAASNVPKSTRVVIIRTGIVLARDGGVLARMLPIFELFAGEEAQCLLTFVAQLCILQEAIAVQDMHSSAAVGSASILPHA